MRRAFLAITVIMVLFFSTGAFAAPGDSMDDPIFISTAEQLDNIRNDLKKCYKLSNDIDLTAYLTPGGAGHAKWGSEGWMPIGSPTDSFDGRIDGAGHKISGLWIKRVNMDYVGLFGHMYISNINTTINNLGIEIAPAGVNGNDSVGGLVGYMDCGSIRNSYVTGGNISGRNQVGGLVGYYYHVDHVEFRFNRIESCYTRVNVSGRYEVGGLVGDGSGLRTLNCYTRGDVIGQTDRVGGLYGVQNLTNIAINCYTTGNISGRNRIGGISGAFWTHFLYYDSELYNSFFTGNVSAISDDAAAIVIASRIFNCFRYQLVRVKDIIPAVNTPNGFHGGIKTAEEFMTKSTYTDNGWLFNDSTPTAGPWHWDDRGFPKLNMGDEAWPWPWSEPSGGTFVPVTNITDVPTEATARTPLTLSGKIEPSNATNRSITWSIFDAGTTGATINDNTLNTTEAGTVIVRATIVNGKAVGVDFTKDFSITVRGVGCNAASYGYLVLALMLCCASSLLLSFAILSGLYLLPASQFLLASLLIS